MKYMQKKLSSDSLRERIFFSVFLFLVLFFGTMILSYYLLPPELLKSKNPLQNWETSNNTFILTFQIFFYNMLSVTVIVLASLFAKKKEWETNYLSVGYITFFALIFMNGIVVGTWSFSVDSDPVPLPGRIIRTFDLIHRAGLWEMMGQLLITCSVAHIAAVLTNGKDTVTRKMKDIHLIKSEKGAFAFGIILMLIGAIVESFAINAL
ncbi:stage II sporulation protein M [Anaerocolumna sp. MB42-C2]|uniref:stage II sporulation protein M n=1 Tax=Anaerocolumna sp. MB42-C2 TaxID=3070997 RepID=UPI0027E1EE95|nr:stage II sporulation protein M [Anaerocolumna sp. MB42-C2]WMJ89241.1 stage II sporulation protein M [Anaerocolumna sp. MB42-C2]